jgi:hypothetical protein
MFSAAFGTVTGVLDRRFVLGFCRCSRSGPASARSRRPRTGGAGPVPGGSTWTRPGTSRSPSRPSQVWCSWRSSRGTQVVPMTRILEGYWSWRWIDKTAGRFEQYRQGKRRARLSQGPSPMGYLREYLAFVPAELGPVMPTHLGNALRAAESYPGGDERWGLDAVFSWPRLCLLLPDSARNQIDEARAPMDQSASQRNALTIGAPSAAVGVVDVHQDQLAVAEQYAATAADVPIQAWCPGKGMLRGQLTDVGLRQVARHRQAHGGRGCLGTNMTSRGTPDTTYLGRSPLGPPAEHALISIHAEPAAGIGGHRHRHRAARPGARPPDADHHPQGRQGRHDTAGTAYGAGDRPGHRRAHGRAGVPGSDGQRLDPARGRADRPPHRAPRRDRQGRHALGGQRATTGMPPREIPNTRENRTGRSVHLHPSATRLNQYARIGTEGSSAQVTLRDLSAEWPSLSAPPHSFKRAGRRPVALRRRPGRGVPARRW